MKLSLNNGLRLLFYQLLEKDKSLALQAYQALSRELEISEIPKSIFLIGHTELQKNTIKKICKLVKIKSKKNLAEADLILVGNKLNPEESQLWLSITEKNIAICTVDQLFKQIKSLVRQPNITKLTNLILENQNHSISLAINLIKASSHPILFFEILWASLQNEQAKNFHQEIFEMIQPLLPSHLKKKSRTLDLLLQMSIDSLQTIEWFHSLSYLSYRFEFTREIHFFNEAFKLCSRQEQQSLFDKAFSYWVYHTDEKHLYLPDRTDFLEIFHLVYQKKNLITLSIPTQPYFLMTRLPEGLIQLKSLEQLDVRASIQDLPEEIKLLNSLRILKVNAISLKIRSDYFIGFQSLTNVRLYMYRAEELPISLYQLKSLIELDLDASDINNISEDCIHLTNLEVLNLRRTQIKSLPASLFSLEKLKKIILQQSPLGKNILDIQRIQAEYPHIELIC